MFVLSDKLNRLYRRLFALGAALLWLGVGVQLGRGAWLRHLARKENLYEGVAAAALAWVVTSAWAGCREKAAPNRGGRLRGMLARLGDRVASVIATTEKALFLWTPILSAVFWSLFGSSLGAAIRAGQSPLDTQQPVFMYFVLAMLFTFTLLSGIAKLRHPMDGRSAQGLRR